MLCLLRLPEAKETRGIPRSCLATVHKPREDAVEVADDLVPQHGALFHLGLAIPYSLLQVQVAALQWLVVEAQVAHYLVADGAHVDLVRLLRPQHVLIPVLRHGVAVD